MGGCVTGYTYVRCGSRENERTNERVLNSHCNESIRNLHTSYGRRAYYIYEYIYFYISKCCIRLPSFLHDIDIDIDGR